MKNEIRKNGLGILSTSALLVATTAGLFFSIESHARTPGQRAARVNHRQATENVRIHQGSKEGDFSRREARDLRSDRREIRRAEHRALKNDGKIGPKEAARLERKQDKLSGKIYKYRHNEEARGNPHPSAAVVPAATTNAPAIATPDTAAALSAETNPTQ